MGVDCLSRGWSYGTVCTVHVCTVWTRKNEKKKKQRKNVPDTVQYGVRYEDTIDHARWKYFDRSIRSDLKNWKSKPTIASYSPLSLPVTLSPQAVCCHYPCLSPTRWSLELCTAKYLKWQHWSVSKSFSHAPDATLLEYTSSISRLTFESLLRVRPACYWDRLLYHYRHSTS